jgi:ABC-type Fe3+/spermidine/putrescine transport system ATPase subunit
MARLVLENVTKRFAGHTAVEGLFLELGDGEVVALLGPSGCGKTTTLRLVAGFERPNEGTVVIEGQDVTRLPAYERDIGLVFQDYALFPHMTVAQNIEYGLRLRRVAAAERGSRRDELLKLVRLSGLEQRRPAELSGGQQQRVALARALAIRPRLLLLDEPLSNLDAKLRETLRTELREILRTVGTTTLVVTHDQAEAMALADRIAVMNSGRIEQIGTAREIYDAPATRFVAEFLGRTIWFDGRVDGAPTDGSTRFVSDDGVTLQVRGARRAAERYGVAIRPERLRLPAAAADENKLPATVERIDYFGDHVMVRARLAGGRVIDVPAPADEEAPAIGSAVVLGARADDCRLTVA